MANITVAGLQNLKNRTKQKFGNLLPDELLNIYVAAFVDSGNDPEQAINAVRTSNAYQNHNTGDGHPEKIDRVTAVIENFKKLDPVTDENGNIKYSTEGAPLYNYNVEVDVSLL